LLRQFDESSEHAGLIHPLDVGHDHGPQQQSTLLDQLGHFRETQHGIAKDLRGAFLGSLGHDRILRVHLLHRLFQECHVIDHRKIAPAASIAQLVLRRPMAQRTVALERLRLLPALREPGRAVSRSSINTLTGNCAANLRRSRGGHKRALNVHLHDSNLPSLSRQRQALGVSMIDLDQSTSLA
jgi:hypothetical protein